MGTIGDIGGIGVMALGIGVAVGGFGVAVAVL